MIQYALVTKQDELSKKIAQEIKDGLKEIANYNQEKPDLVISVGGDGTMLTSVHQYLNQDVGYIGVHTGTLGFYTDYLKDEIDELIMAIKNNQYKINHRNLLEVSVYRHGKKDTYLALNEMRIDYGFVTQVIFFLVFIFGFCPVVGGLLRGKFALQRNFIHLGNKLAFGDDRIVVGIQFVDDTRYLRTHFDFCDRFYRTGCRNSFRHIASCCRSGFDDVTCAF